MTGVAGGTAGAARTVATAAAAEPADLTVHRKLPAEWARLEGGGLYRGVRWLSAFDQRFRGEPRYFLAQRDGRVRLGAHGTVLRGPASYEALNLHRLLLGVPSVVPLAAAAEAERPALAERAPPPEAWFPSLVMVYPGYDCGPVGPGADDPAEVEAMRLALERWAAEHGMATIAHLYGAAAMGGQLEAAGYAPFPLEARYLLALPGGGLDGYLGALGPRRAQRVRAELRVVGANGVELGTRPLAACADAITALRVLLVEKYGHATSWRQERDRLDALVRAFGPGRFTVVTAERAGRLLGFSLFLRDGSSWHAIWTGSDYGDPCARHVHFATLFYQAVAAANGVREIDYGVGGGRTKLARGCVEVPLLGWARATEPRLAPWIHQAAAAMRAAR